MTLASFFDKAFGVLFRLPELWVGDVVANPSTPSQGTLYSVRAFSALYWLPSLLDQSPEVKRTRDQAGEASVTARVTTNLLIKTKGTLPSATLSLGAANTSFAVTPLFKSIGLSASPGAAAPGTWYRLTAQSDVAEPNPWDLCHQLMTQGLGVAGAAPEFAEPDLLQRWIVDDEGTIATALAGACDKQDPQNEKFPRKDNQDGYWFRKGEYAQFDDALARIGGPDVTSKVRIAHLDTGYDPDHTSTPKRLRRDLERDFVDGGTSAADRSDGVLTNLGHGTGTLSLLAGVGSPLLGGAPFAEIVSIRVANRVVLFHNSAIAQAFDYIHSLHGDPNRRIDVITMSMGGLPSRAWADAVNALYEQGVFIVTAAGNNFGNLPTREIVWPARFGRVVAACGVMADHTHYADLGIDRMAGNYGPNSKMRTAIAAFTPNVPWARFGCPQIVDLNGAGTSAATPQVAAAAATWIQHHRTALDAYPKGWMRVEAVRKALFDSAKKDSPNESWFGQGELRVNAALGEKPAADNQLRQQAPDSTSFSIVHVLLGVAPGAAPDGRQLMLELEALQLSQSPAVQAALKSFGADGQPTLSQQRQLLEALAAEPGASRALRQALKAEAPARAKSFKPDVADFPAMQRMHLEQATNPPIPKPTSRPLRVYAYDPSLEADLETLSINVATLNVRWEQDLLPGPVGEYLEVIDVDPSSRCCYAPIDLNESNVIIRDGLDPSEANPLFHQQMVYAVAMKTIEHFERALGRVALWAPQQIKNEHGITKDEHYVQRLRIYPHALRTRNAYYSPEKKALLLGYFTAQREGTLDVLPSGTVFTAVSHDIIAHETTHALLDGLHRRFLEPTNDDVLAFHEGFADIVALFQHFTIPEALRHEIAKTRGDLRGQNLLVKLAVQFGHATGSFAALRDAIGEVHQGADGTPQWEPRKPSTDDYSSATEAHGRGSVLVAAVFDAFLQLYAQRAAQLIRLATGGRGVLEPGEIPVALADALAEAASKIAGDVLNICIRALDYCPPIDITFGDFLRALITADTDLVPDDVSGYRTAFIAAFRAREIYPSNVKHFSQNSLVWEPPPLPLKNIKSILDKLVLSWDLRTSRRRAYDVSRHNAQLMHDWLCNSAEVDDDEFEALGFSRKKGQTTFDGISGQLHTIEVHSVRPARRIGPDGQSRSHLVIEITQTFWPDDPTLPHVRGGCTLLVDLEKHEASYFVRKKLNVAAHLQGEQRFAMASPLHGNYFEVDSRSREPLAMLHQVYG